MDPDILAAVLAAVFYDAVVVNVDCCVREESLLVLLTIFPKSRRWLPAANIVEDGMFLFVAAMAVVMVSVDSGSGSGGSC